MGESLADQLLVPRALAGGGAFTTGPLSRHAQTNIEVIKKFIDVVISSTLVANRLWQIRIPASCSLIKEGSLEFERRKIFLLQNLNGGHAAARGCRRRSALNRVDLSSRVGENRCCAYC